ncbi:MAG TPA: hypothetical protein VK470_15515 [Bacteroidota bacterium]|nr:hypothetical protein [Bacteroidota bacterium]
MVLHLMIAFAASVGISLVLTPQVMKLAAAVGAMDYPNARKVHTKAMPRMGGVAICGGFFASFLLLVTIDSSIIAQTWLSTAEGLSLAMVLFLVLALGIWDDIDPLGPAQKFLVQLLLSTIIYLAGFRISTISLPFMNQTLCLGLFDYPLTMIWMIGITNAINLIDGLDGLASGVATIAFLTISPIAIFNGDMGTACMALLLSGALIGFLRFNFNPARIFLGDSGSLFLGFALSVLSMHSSTKGSAAFAIVVPILALGLPIMDTFLSMARRLLRSFLPDAQTANSSLLNKLKSMFQPDKSHIHHRLLARGLSHRNAVLVLYAISFALGITAFSLTVMSNFDASFVLGAVGASTVIGVRQLRYREMAVLQNGVFLPLYNHPLMKRDALQVFFDVAFILVSFSCAYALTHWLYGLPQEQPRVVVELLAAVTVIQVSVFRISGLYRGTFRLLGLGDVLRMIKCVGFALTATIITGIIVVSPLKTDHVLTLMLDFYFLLTLVVGFRMSFRVLQYLSHKDLKAGKRVLFYGADDNGIMMLDRILDSTVTNYSPIGFLDDDSTLEGKTLNGYPIYGGHWKLSFLLRTIGVDEIILCSDSIKETSMTRLRLTAQLHHIPIRKMRVICEDILHEERVHTTEASGSIIIDAPAGAGESGDAVTVAEDAHARRHTSGGVCVRPMKSRFA